MTNMDPELQAQIDAQLLEQGAFSPLELLFNTGRLLYSDYEVWRRGEVELLDSVLMGNKENVRGELELAVGYARGIGLVEELQEFHAWNADAPAGSTAQIDQGARAGDKAQIGQGARAGGKALRISADSRLGQLIAARYLPAQKAPQMDLFFDNPVVALANGIVQALCAGNAAEAERRLDRLYAQAPNHSDLPGFDQLLAALVGSHQPIEDPRQERERLLNIAPVAKRLLGTQWRELLSPLWRRLADALADHPFAPGDPAMHRSFALSQAQDWTAVRDSVLAEPEWQLHAPLCLQLADSAFHRRQRIEALMAWCHLCWRAPEYVEEALEKVRQPELTALWRRFVDSDEEDETLTAADFPAWLLINEPGLALHLDGDLPTGEMAGEEHFRCVHRCIAARRAQRQEEELAARKALQASQPTLFEILKRSLSRPGFPAPASAGAGSSRE